MGEENKISLSEGLLYVEGENGEWLPMMPIEEVEEFETTAIDYGDDHDYCDYSISTSDEITMTFDYHYRQSWHKIIIPMIYGWKCRGPVRKRSIMDSLIKKNLGSKHRYRNGKL